MGLDVALWRAVAAFRFISLGYAAVLVVHNRHAYERPALAWTVLALMAVWSVVVTRLYAARLPSPGWVVLGADLAIAVGAVLSTRAVLTQPQIASGDPTLPVSWAASPVLAWAVAGGALAGGLAGAAIAAADLIERWSAPSEATVNGVVLLVVVGVVVGYVVGLARDAQARLARAVELEAAGRERERLAARIHDGVLQVLALVARRGNELGGDAAELGRLAGEQEAALRALVASTPEVGVDGTVDLRGSLAAYADGRTTVSAPADAVLLPARTSGEITAAVAAALDNVTRHAGEGARAWVLVEAEPDAVIVTVRDDGVGFSLDRLGEAAAAGRLGVAMSIESRIVALGGSVAWTSAPGEGTEVELRVPR